MSMVKRALNLVPVFIVTLSCGGGGERTPDGDDDGGGGRDEAPDNQGGNKPGGGAGGMAGSAGTSVDGDTGGAAAGGQPGEAPASGGGGGPGSTPQPMGAAQILGTGDHTAASVKLTKLATATGCLSKPTDLAFNPRRPDELWVVNHGDNSACIIVNAREATLRSERRREPSHEHFMPRPMGLAFGGDKTTFGIMGTFATANDSAGDSHPDDGAFWNGITLWSSDLSIFGKFRGTDGNSHLDMLHDSPLARGIAWEKDNIYWVFGGMFDDITRYDFASDHERGNFDHSDGSQWHYAAGKIKGVENVPSHLVYDPSSKLLYIADTGNGRVAVLDTSKGTVNPKRHTRTKDRPETKVDAAMDGTVINDLVAAGGDLKRPAGIELSENVLFVTDNATGHIHAFNLKGERLNWVDTGLGAGNLGGITVGPDKKVYFVAMTGNAVYSLAP